MICEVRDDRKALVRRAFSLITRDHTLGCPFPCLTNDKQEGVSEAWASIHSGLSRSRAYPVPCITPRATMNETHRLPRCLRGCYRRSRGRSAEHRASFGSDGRSHEGAYPSHVRVGTTKNRVAISTGQDASPRAFARTSSRCLTFFTNMFPSAANPLTASTARSVLYMRDSGSR